jgi:hypothetical protein
VTVGQQAAGAGAKKLLRDDSPQQVVWNTLFQAADASAAPTANQPRASTTAVRVVLRMMGSPRIRGAGRGAGRTGTLTLSREIGHLKGIEPRRDRFVRPPPAPSLKSAHPVSFSQRFTSWRAFKQPAERSAGQLT